MKTNKLILQRAYLMPLLFGFLFLITQNAKAGTRYVWVGGVTGHVSDWNQSGNWTPNTGYPGSGGSTTDAAVITFVTNEPNLNVSVTIDSLLIKGQGTLTYTAGNVLTITGNAVIGPSTSDGGASSTLDFSSGTGGSVDLSIGGSVYGFGGLNLYGAGQTIQIGGDMLISGFTPNAGSIGSTVSLNGTGAQSVNPGNTGTASYQFDYLAIDNTSVSGVTLNTSGHIEIDGDLSGSGKLNTGATNIRLLGNLSMGANKFNVGGNAEELDLLGDNSTLISTYQQTISNAQTFYFVDIYNQDVLLGGDVTIKHNLNFDDDGDIVLQGHNLDLTSGSITWVRNLGATFYDSGYVVTDNAHNGYLKLTTSHSGIQFPVGAVSHYNGSGNGQYSPYGSGHSYTPITIKSPTGTNPVLDVRTFQGPTDKTGTAITTDAVNNEWVINPENTKQDFQITTSWSSWPNTDELSGFSESATFLSFRHQDPGTSGSPYQWYPLGSTSGANTYDAANSRNKDQDSIDAAATVSIGTDNAIGITYIATGSNTTALPVTLVSFGAQYQDGHVNLDWATSSEQNNAYFEIERSLDAANWTNIGQVQGHGTTDVYNNYMAIDNLAGVVPSGQFYYRLKQVDFNDKFTYSNIRSVDLSNPGPTIATYPNPTNNILNVNWTSTSDDNALVRLVNMSGVNVYEQNVSGKGLIQQKIDMSALPSGVYYLQIISNNNSMVNQPVYKN